ncbi:PadR family transcriptional regulator [Silvibacterium sp.]|uniref:PadR family transcriptional regulator n=1 Tax=Silvibacterium sp. TaxID=1964179 RepID=UPI0039E52C71
MKLRRTPQTALVLGELLRSSREWRYGYDISRDTGLKSGTLYPLLIRLAEQQLLETKWEDSPENGRPPRHLYRLTANGVRVAREWADARITVNTRKPILGV